MEKNIWGKDTDGRDITIYTIQNSKGMSVRTMDYGANVLSICVPDSQGNTADVVLGFESLEDYFVNDAFFGCCVVPSCNRIGKAQFTLNGKTYLLDKNDGENNLHGGSFQICRCIWEVTDVSDASITFSYHKKDGEMRFPGNMDISVTYTVTEENELRIDYLGLSDADTIFNPTNHSYFHLGGQGSGDVLDHVLWLNASFFTMTDPASIPNGTLVNVADTPMDFTTPKPIGRDIDSDYEPLLWAGGYDHNFVIDKTEGELALAASVHDPKSGRYLEVFTDRPGIQVYCGNYISSNDIGKGKIPYGARYGLALETQYYPNAINIASFPQPVAKAHVPSRSTTIYKFSNRA